MRRTIRVSFSRRTDGAVYDIDVMVSSYVEDR